MKNLTEVEKTSLKVLSYLMMNRREDTFQNLILLTIRVFLPSIQTLVAWVLNAKTRLVINHMIQTAKLLMIKIKGLY